MKRMLVVLMLVLVAAVSGRADDDATLRVFIFAGQSNMVGSDSKVRDIQEFPPFVGLEESQPDVRFSYCLGRETKMQSDGWTALQPVDNVVGPELSFARQVKRQIKAPIAIIKVAAGGTHLGGDWNPDEPSGLKMYPLALARVREGLADLDKMGIKYRLEGFMWHQGENDMFNQEYMDNYGRNLKHFLECWRRDLKSPNLRFYIGELCTKTIWGMDLRPRMYAISVGQKMVTSSDPLAQYVPTSHVGVDELALCQGFDRKTFRFGGTSQHGRRTRLRPAAHQPRRQIDPRERQPAHCLSIQRGWRLQGIEWLGAARACRML